MNFVSHRFLFITGTLVVIMPFLGFPTFWKTVCYVVFGLFIIITSLFLKGSKRPSGKAWVLKHEKTFVENSPSTGGKRRVTRKKAKEENSTPTVHVPEPISDIIHDTNASETKEKQNGTLHGA